MADPLLCISQQVAPYFLLTHKALRGAAFRRMKGGKRDAVGVAAIKVLNTRAGCACAPRQLTRGRFLVV